MWLKVVVVGLKAAAGQKPKAAEVFCRFNVNESPCQVQDQSLAAFCWPLGPENQTPKEFMAAEVRFAGGLVAWHAYSVVVNPSNICAGIHAWQLHVWLL